MVCSSEAPPTCDPLSMVRSGVVVVVVGNLKRTINPVQEEEEEPSAAAKYPLIDGENRAGL